MTIVELCIVSVFVVGGFVIVVEAVVLVWLVLGVVPVVETPDFGDVGVVIADDLVIFVEVDDVPVVDTTDFGDVGVPVSTVVVWMEDDAVPDVVAVDTK